MKVAESEARLGLWERGKARRCTLKGPDEVISEVVYCQLELTMTLGELLNDGVDARA